MSGYADWNAFTTYNVNDVINYQGFLYVALQISLNRVPPSNPTFWSSTSGPGGGVSSLNAQTGPVLLTSSSIAITNPVAGTINIETPAIPVSVTTLNGESGVVNLVSGGGTVVISTPSPGNINLESITDGIQTITAGSGISVTPGANPTIDNTGILSVGTGAGIGSSGGQNPTLTNTGLLSLNSQVGIASLTSSGGSITITTPVPGTINIEAPISSGGIVFTDVIPSISTAGGFTTSSTAYTIPSTGTYMFIWELFVANSATGGGPFTSCSWNPNLTGGTAGTQVGEGVALQAINGSGTTIGTSSVTSIPAISNSFFGSTTQTRSDVATLPAGSTVRHQVQVQQNGSPLNWGYAQSTLQLVRIA